MRRGIAGGAVLIVAVAAIVLAPLGTVSHTSRRDVASAGRRAITTAPGGARHRLRHRATAITVSSPTLTPGRMPDGPAATRMRAALTRALALARPDGARVATGALVYDLDAHAEVYGAHPSVGRAPASVQKLWTTAALMDRLGPRARLHTAVLGSGTLRHGTWHGDLYLRGDGDPTFGDPEFNRVWNHGEGSSAAALVAQLRRRGIRRVSGRVYGDESLFDRRRGGLLTGYTADVPDLGGQLSALTYDHGTTTRHDDPATFAAHEMVLVMRASGIAATASTHTRTTPHDARLLATVASPPLQAMTRLMNVPSDDLFAELLTKQLGVLFGHGGTISAGARVISHTIAADYDLHPTILDGSGLSLDDRTSPVQIVDLLRDLWHTPTGSELAASLPTVGVNGTVQGIGVRTPAQGRCVAKTGTLTDVSNLAGYCHSRGGHELAFAVFVDGPSNATAFTLISRMVGAIARY